jgi:hypothetical protein
MQLTNTDLSQSFKVLDPPVPPSEVILHLVDRVIHGLMMLVGGFLLAGFVLNLICLILGVFLAEQVVPD